MEFKGHTRVKRRKENKVLIESDWNLKKKKDIVRAFVNRSINRIRLEFKGKSHGLSYLLQTVLIESDWNLKYIENHQYSKKNKVLIESDWNLKFIALVIGCQCKGY